MPGFDSRDRRAIVGGPASAPSPLAPPAARPGSARSGAGPDHAWGPEALAVTGLAAAVTLFAASLTVADPDLWWHLRVGADIWDERRVPRADPYSFLSGEVPWVNHEWLAEAILAAAWRIGGDPGLVLLKVAVASALTYLVGRRLRRRGASRLSAALVAVTGLIAMLPGLGSLRPQIFSVLFVVVLLLILDGSRPGSRRRWWLPVLVALWANLHGGVLLGALLAVSWLAIEAISIHRRPPASASRGGDRRTNQAPGEFQAMSAGRCARVAAGSLAAATLAAFGVNPYGPGLALFLAGASMPRSELAEWQPLSLGWFDGLSYVACLAAVGLAMSGGRRAPSWPARACLAVLALLPLVARRHHPFFVAATLVLAAPAAVQVAGEWVARRWPGAVRPSRPDRRWHRAIVGAMVIEAVVLAIAAVPRIRCIRVDPDAYPARAVEILRRAGVEGDMAVFFDWGGYALWRLGPRVRVSIDPRRESVYSPRTVAANLAWMLGDAAGDAVLAAPVSLALVGPAWPAFGRLQESREWVLAYADRTSALFVRAGAPQAAPVLDAARRGTVEPARCLAGHPAADGWTAASSGGARRPGDGSTGSTDRWMDGPVTRNPPA